MEFSMACEHLTRPSLAALLSGFSLEENLCIASLSINTSPEQPGEHHEGLLEHQQTVQRLGLGDLGLLRRLRTVKVVWKCVLFVFLVLEVVARLDYFLIFVVLFPRTFLFKYSLYKIYFFILIFGF